MTFYVKLFIWRASFMDLTLWKKTKKERGLTYQDIARESGLPLGTIKNIFAGYT